MANIQSKSILNNVQGLFTIFAHSKLLFTLQSNGMCKKMDLEYLKSNVFYKTIMEVKHIGQII